MRNRLVILLLLSFLFLGCGRESKNAGEIGARIKIANKASKFKVPVKVVIARKGSIQEKITIYGKLLPKRKINLSSQFSGRILNLNLSEGDRVLRGETIALVQSPQAEALKRVVNDSSNGEVLPYKITAPFSGIVSKKFHYSGDVVSKGESILTIQDDSVYYLWGELPANYLPDVHVGQSLNVTFPDLKGKTFNAKIEAVNGIVDKQTQTAQIRASLQNKSHLLKSDLFLKIEIILKSLNNVLVIPRNAVLGNSPDYFLFVKKNGKAKRKTLRVGIENENRIEIKAGLNVGDSVIVLGNYELKDGMSVK